MTYKMISADVKTNGEVRLPQSVRRALHLQRKGGLVGFVVERERVVLTRATIVPDAPLSDEEMAFLARSSKGGAGRRTFQTRETALRYLWSL